MEREFIEARAFSGYTRKHGSDEDVRRIQNEILRNPRIGALIRGTGGVRKFRYAKAGEGKSGGWRVFYLDLPKALTTFLLLAFGKSEKETISGEERVAISKLVEAIKQEVRR